MKKSYNYAGYHIRQRFQKFIIFRIVGDKWFPLKKMSALNVDIVKEYIDTNGFDLDTTLKQLVAKFLVRAWDTPENYSLQVIKDIEIFYEENEHLRLIKHEPRRPTEEL